MRGWTEIARVGSASGTRRLLRLVVGPTALATTLTLLVQVAPAGAADGYARDDTASTVRGRAVDVDVTANDDGDDLEVVAISNSPEHGDADITSDGTVRYRPDEDFVGTDSFRYQVADQEGRRDQATVTVTVAEAVSVRSDARWRVLVPATLSGTGPAGTTLEIRVTGPHTSRRLTATTTAAGTWQASVTPAWPGQHSVVVTSSEPEDRAELRVAAVAKYLWSVSGPLSRADLRHSYRRGCPVAPSSLRELSVTYWNWNGRPRIGRLVAHRKAVADLRAVFRVAFRTNFPIRKMKPVEAYYKNGRRSPTQSDKSSMRADNTSAFNCRPVTGVRWRRSPHSFGTAIDINPRENPYVTARRTYPKGVASYLRRGKVRKGMLTASSPVVKEFKRRGWRWGTRYRHPDYQHFDM